MVRLLFTFLSVLFFIPAHAQKKDYRWSVEFYFRNKITQEIIKASDTLDVKLMLADSTVIGSFRTLNNNTQERYAFLRLDKLFDGTTKDYILEISHPKYETTYYPLHLKFRKHNPLTTIYVDIRRLTHMELAQMLGEVQVNATKVKFYVNEDTLVYNADAFELSEGSMLDALIEQLPGVELKDDGRIYVNGRFVESLLLNGKDFFKGDNLIMLENLPSYMVKNIQVYDKMSDQSEFFGAKVDEGIYTMDVQLKRRYSVGWLGNAEAGVGTKDRFMGRLFAMRFTPQSRLSIFGNVNNTNDRRKPGRSGDWSPADISGGLTTTKNVGIDYGVWDKINRYTIEGSAQLKHSRTEHITRSNNTNFLPGGDTYERIWNNANSKELYLTTRHELTKNFKLWRDNYRHPGIQLRITPQVEYRNYDNSSSSTSGVFDIDPSTYADLLDSLSEPTMGSSLRSILINRKISESMGRGHRVNYGADFYLGLSTPNVNYDGLYINGNVSAYDQKNESFDRYKIDYTARPDGDFRNRYFNTPNSGYSFTASAKYYWHTKPMTWTGLTLGPMVSFWQGYSRDVNSLYRLDELEGWGDGSDTELGLLPSEASDLMQSLDRDNSYLTGQLTRRTRGQLQFLIQLPEYDDSYNMISDFYMSITPGFMYEDKTLRFDGSVYSGRKLTNWFPEADIQLTRRTRGLKHKLEFEASLRMQSPSLMNMLDVTFDSNPLYVRNGNPSLKNSAVFRVNLSYSADRWLSGSGKMLNASVGYTNTRNATAISSVYDKSTGVRTTTPVNVNGNWDSWYNLNWSVPLDKAKKFNLSSNTNINYGDKVDMMSTADLASSLKNVVHNLYARQLFNLSYNFGKHRLGAKFRASWTNARGSMEDFEDINAVHLTYALTGQFKLPWNLQVNTDVSLYSRRGYGDKSMNTDDFVWNARVSKSFLGGSLIVMLDCFDILGNLTNINYSLNSQGRWEVYNNVIPSYGMFHIIYKLNKEPKKK